MNSRVFKLILCSQFALINAAFANPVLEGVAAGTVNFNQNKSSLIINQHTDKAIINWKSFNIKAHEKTQFIQPNNSSVALNRINPTQGASQIYGSLISNGRIILINQAGIYFSATARVDVGSLIASTTDISNSNFLAGQYIFDQSSYYQGSIVNEGSIKAKDFGLVALVGNNVINKGVIKANLGHVVLATGEKFTFDFTGDQLINFTVEKPASSGKIVNKGSIIADGGTILVSANSANKILDNTINMSGVAQANSVAEKNGEIILMANEGTVTTSGKLSARGMQPGSKGGSIRIMAKNIKLKNGTNIDASSDLGSGRITLAGNQGAAQNIIIDKHTNLNVSASGNDTFAGSISINAQNVNLEGNLMATGLGNNSGGGRITITGNAINIEGNNLLHFAIVDARGHFGGLIEIGNNPDFMQTTNQLNLNKSVITAASTGTNGGGGIIRFRGDSINVGLSYIDASGTFSGSFGGQIQAFGNQVHLTPLTVLNTNGNLGGGIITLGTDHFLSDTPTTANIILDQNTYLLSSGLDANGFGGNINLFAVNVDVNAQLEARGVSSDGTKGTINVLGNHLHLRSQSTLNTSSQTGGGNIFVGGNKHGQGFLPRATDVIVDSGARINASALNSGNGGDVVFWADNAMNFAGNVQSRGGAASGNGGFVQINGLNVLNYMGSVDVSAPQGNPGTFVLGP